VPFSMRLEHLRREPARVRRLVRSLVEKDGKGQFLGKRPALGGDCCLVKLGQTGVVGQKLARAQDLATRPQNIVTWPNHTKNETTRAWTPENPFVQYPRIRGCPPEKAAAAITMLRSAAKPVWHS
jgi:hypothetical protein